MTTGRTDLTGRTGVIVGPGSETDTAIVDALLTAGATVLFAATEPDPALGVVEERDSLHRVATYVASDPGRFVKEACEVAGGVDILVQHRPTTSRLPISRLAREDWELDLARIVDSVTLATAFAEVCEPNASIVTILSLDVAQAYPERATAAVVSNGLIGATRAMAVEWARKPIRVNAVATGPVLSEGDQMSIADGRQSLERMLLRAPSHRIGMPAETASLVRFLVDGRSEFVTGQVIWVDGGWAALTQHAEGLRFP